MPSIPPIPLAMVSAESSSLPPEEEYTLARERKHACSMCHKRFDRPSTLRKHLLVHTGEKAFQCSTCGRRFGVASNLNRHVRRCILKPVNQPSSQSSQSSQSPPTITTTITTTSSQSPEPSAQAQPRSASYKRRRRAPSPSRWIPDSLRGFILDLDSAFQLKSIVSIPLPPVTPSPYGEERDSWDENVGNAPYHPREWQVKPRLPGPGVIGADTSLRGMSVFGGKDVGNLGNGGGLWGGSVLVF
ncbi:hypothetical protein BT96DRAFT_250298 [Gymnopus androsaceus JB14]|uniref:C2H2-type domain-containing protein n=1 Tax=Gymnopus androsaceus JB14 TaxID=1447944 RepID=A0A6A4IAL8_9AGAR|nr:hypothetical protein BT96DRAFT_250298 [Gymnopus androsaceus JB14]